jgi:autotransporter-associated beta strand protein
MPIIFRAIVFLSALAFSHFAAAQPALWNGGGGSDNRWSLGENWQGGTAPAPGDSIRFLNSAVGSAARYDMLFSTIPSISVEKCGFSAVTDSGSVTPITVQNITGSCDGVGVNLQNLLEMRINLDSNASINALTTDTDNTNTRRFIVRQPGGAGINAGANLVLNPNSFLGASGALPILELTLASGDGIVKAGSGRVDFLNPNSYVGETIVSTGILNVGNAQALGATGVNDFTTVRSVATLAISTGSPISEEIRLEDNSDVVGNDPTLAGFGVVNHSISSVVRITGLATAPTGTFIAKGSQLQLLAGITATAPATTRVNYLGSVPGSEIVLGGPTNHGGLTKVGNNAALVLAGAMINDNRLSNNSIIDIDLGGRVDLMPVMPSVETIGGLMGAGDVQLFSTMDLTLNSEIDTVFSGNLTGGRVIKSGFNVVTISGAFNPENLSINQGEVVLQSDSTARVQLGGGRLVTAGSRTVRGLELLSAPGSVLDLNDGFFETLTVEPNVIAPNGISIASGAIAFNLSTGSSDQIVLANTNNLGSVILSGGVLQFTGSTTIGVPIIMLNNQRPPANLISGTFAAPFDNPAGGTAVVNSNSYSYTYAGGNGNDFSITRLGTPATITTMTLPDAVLNQPYVGNFILSSGGTSPYTYTLSSGALPAGLMLQPNGQITGAPTAAGTFSFVVAMTDSSTPTPQTDTQALTLLVVGTDFTWTGNGGMSFWNDPSNWSPALVPPPGSSLIFPAGVTNKIASNNLPFGSAFRSIQVLDTGYFIDGVNLQLTDAVPLRYDPPSLAGPPSVVAMAITATAASPKIAVNLVGSAFQPQIFDVAAPSGGISYTGELRVEIVCPSCTAEADVILRSASLAGSSLSVFAPNGGVQVVAATHDGITRIEAGVLLAGAASSLGTVTGSLSDGTEIWRGALLLIDPGITNEHLNFKNMGTGNPPMLGPLMVGQTFAGPILVESDFRIMGSQTPFFNFASDMIGAGNIEIVAAGTPLAIVARSPKTDRGLLTGVSLSGVPVTSIGDVSVTANTELRLNSTNKLPATTNISLPPASRLFVNAAQTLEGLTGSGTVEFDSATLTLSHDDTKTFAGPLIGVNGLLAFNSPMGTGVLELTSAAPGNNASYRADRGTLDLKGISTGAVRIGAGTLAGIGATSGAVESLPGATGKIAPMLGDLGTGNLDIDDGLTFEAIVNGDITGQYTQLQVTGSVELNDDGGNATLVVQSNATLVPGTVVTIIDNDTNDTITDFVDGTFHNLPDGAQVTASNGQTFLIDYQGGDGNDVTLTRQAAGLIDVTIGNLNITEGLSGTTTQNVVFTRSAGGSAFTVNGLLTSGTADAADYVAGPVVASFTATGPNIVSVPIQITGDNIVEGAETLSVVVASAPSGVNPIAPGLVTILNDDTSSIAFNASSALEGSGGGTGPAPLVVSLSNPIQGVVSFNMASTGGTATSGLDYTPFSQTLSLTSLQIQANPTLDVVRDVIVEADESVSFTLSGLVLPSGISPADVTLVAASAQHLIQNDDSAIITVTSTTQAEGNSANTPFIIGLTLSAPVQGDVTVRYTPTQLAGDTATPITDFATAPQVAIFGSGVTSSNVTIQVVGDTVVEPDETFSSVLDQLTTVGGVSASAFTFGFLNKVTIQNDDLNAATTTTLSISPSPSTAGQAYTATAIVRNVGPTFPTGSVVISTVPASSETCTTTALLLLTSDSSTASCQITSALPGVRTYIATYVPTGSFSASTSANVPHVVRGEIGNLQISSSLPAGVVTGQTYTITVGLVPTIPGAPAPTGNVAIQHFPSPQMDSGAMMGGTVSIATFSSTAVIKTLFVSYTDPTGVYPNRSSAFAQVVNKADVALSSLNSTPQPSTVGQPVTASFALSVVAPGLGIPTGTVTVTDGVDQCIATLPATSCVITLRTAGNRTLTYRYDGSIDYNAGLATRPHTVGNSANGSDVEITVSNGVTVVPQDRIVQYQVRSRVLAGDSASNVRVQAAVPAGIVSQIWSCVAENGATCPPNSTNVNGAIDAIVTLPQAGSALFVISALTQAVEGRVQFSANVSVAAPVVDPNPQNNSATDNDVISNTATESGFEDE